MTDVQGSKLHYIINYTNIQYFELSGWISNTDLIIYHLITIDLSLYSWPIPLFQPFHPSLTKDHHLEPIDI